MSVITQPAFFGLTGKFKAYSPLSLGAALKIFWDAENAVESGGVVTSVPNAGTISLDLAPTKGTYEPTLSGSAGQKKVVHDGVDDCLKTSEIVDDLAGWTIYAVAQCDGNGTFIEFGNPESLIYSNQVSGFWYGNSPTVNLTPPTGYRLMKYVFDPADTLSRDTAIRIGNNSYETKPCAVAWKVIIAVNRALTAGEATQIENWLTARL